MSGARSQAWSAASSPVASPAEGASPRPAPATQAPVQPEASQAAVQQPVVPQAAPASGSQPGGSGSAASAPAISGSEADIPVDLGEDAPAAGASGGVSDNMMPLWQLGLKLGAVLVLAYASLYVLRRFLSGNARPGAPLGALQVRSSIPLGPGRSLHVVAVDGRQFLIASTAQQVTLLTELAPPSGYRAGGDKSDGAAESFQEQLQRLSAQPGRAGRGAAANLGEPAGPDPRTLSDDELREEVRRKLLALNRGAHDAVRLRQATGGGQDEPWGAR